MHDFSICTLDPENDFIPRPAKLAVDEHLENLPEWEARLEASRALIQSDGVYTSYTQADWDAEFAAFTAWKRKLVALKTWRDWKMAEQQEMLERASVSELRSLRNWDPRLIDRMLAERGETPAIGAGTGRLAIEAPKTQAQIERAAEERKLARAGLTALPQTWWGHCIWLHRTFGEEQFTAIQVREAALEDPDWAVPADVRPERIDPKFCRELGMNYAKVARVMFENEAWIEPGVITHGVRRWRVVIKSTPPESIPPNANHT